MSSTIIISYWPLYDPTKDGIKSGDHTDIATIDKHITNLQTNYTAGNAKACLWAQTNNTIHPILIIDKAKELVDHLHLWAEGDPYSWFDAYIYNPPNVLGNVLDNVLGTYCVAIIPKISRSIARYRLGRLINHEEFTIDDDTTYSVIFSPIIFGTTNSQTYTKNINKLPPIGTDINIGFLDTADCDMEHPDKTDDAKITTIRLARGDTGNNISTYLDQFLSNMETQTD